MHAEKPPNILLRGFSVALYRESMMIRILLPACLFLAAILLFHTDLPTTAYQAHAATRVAQEDSDKAQAPDTSAPDTDSSDKFGSPPKDEE
jgi:hypothetical protein